MSDTESSGELTLQAKVTCPHCWHAYIPEESLWVSEHPDLIGDAKLGFEHAKRFLPSRFSVQGDALDEQGHKSTRMACPHCHLEVPRPLYQLNNIFFSILGAPACGKSYFLASLTWGLRQNLPSRFRVSMNDADASSNARLHQYEEMQFLSGDPDKPVALEKTEEQGDLYDVVNMGDHSVTLPRPFMFTLQPTRKHPSYQHSQTVSKVISLYDNAGESFLPGADKSTSPVTRHLALSKALFFCFDPTQDPRFRKACEGKSDDPQMVPRAKRLERENSVRQDTILVEATQRVRRHAGLREDQLHKQPLIVVVTKWDSWHKLLPDLSHKEPYKKINGQPIQAINVEKILKASQQVELLLEKLCPEIVATAIGFAEEVFFIPISATGRGPEVDPETGALGIRPRDIKPWWVEIPLLLGFHRSTRGLVGGYYGNQEKKKT
jgi:hypothetical protein